MPQFKKNWLIKPVLDLQATHVNNDQLCSNQIIETPMDEENHVSDNHVTISETFAKAFAISYIATSFKMAT
jgi:hypothetical protein